MPTITETRARAFAFCRNPYCAGYNGSEVDVVREERSTTHKELGGKGTILNGVESSTIDLRFADPEDAACPGCSVPRELSPSPRPSYEPLSGFPQDGLLSAPKFDPDRQEESRDERTANLEAELAKTQAQLAEVLAALKTKPEAS